MYFYEQDGHVSPSQHRFVHMVVYNSLRPGAQIKYLISKNTVTNPSMLMRAHSRLTQRVLILNFFTAMGYY